MKAFSSGRDELSWLLQNSGVSSFFLQQLSWLLSGQSRLLRGRYFERGEDTDHLLCVLRFSATSPGIVPFSEHFNTATVKYLEVLLCGFKKAFETSLGIALSSFFNSKFLNASEGYQKA